MIPTQRNGKQPGIPPARSPNFDLWEQDLHNDLEIKGWRRIVEEIRHFYRHPAVTVLTWTITGALATWAAMWLTAQLT